MRQALFFLALVTLHVSAFSSATIGQQAPAGRQGGAPGGRQGGPPPVQLAEGAGREQVQAACTRCHGLNMITNSWGYTKEGWQDRIATMVKLPSDELETVSSYLGAHALPRPQHDHQLVGLHEGGLAGSHRHHGEAAFR